MKFQIMTEILFTLLARRRVSASELAARFSVSTRTIYRYLEEMTVAGVPIDLVRGAGGGAYISDAYKLPKGFMTKEEYLRAVDAMTAMNEQLRDETLARAIEKLSAQVKTELVENVVSGSILVDGGSWGTRGFSDKLAILERAIEERERLDVEYVDRGGEASKRTILPHLLVLKQNVWYVYAYCEVRKAFRLFKAGRIRSVVKSGISFERIPFERSEIPLTFWESEKTVDAVLAISPSALPLAEEWLGVENIECRGGEHFASVTLPDDEGLTGKILSFGAGLKVVYPASLKERVRREAAAIAAQ